MKKTLISAALASTLLATASVQALELNDENQKLSYSLGLVLGGKLKADLETLDLKAFQAGIQTVYKDSKPLLDNKQVSETMQAYQLRKLEEQRQALAKIAEDNLKAGQVYAAENGKRDGVVTTDSGLQYEELKAGSGKQPNADDTVKVHYRGTLIDGTEFDSSYARNEPVSFPLNGVIPGWTEGLQRMKEGGKARLVIPADLAYGPGGMGNAIGPNSTLIFEVELLEVNPEAE